MQIAALQKLTLLDYPSKTAATVFTTGCNFRCGYCHNSELVLPEKFPTELISEKDFFEFLDKRKNLLDGVCITGGESTLQKDLPEFLKQIRKRGFFTKLDTNGSNPEILAKLFKSRLLDYVAMDVKASLKNYKKLVGVGVAKKIESSKNLIMQSGVDYEFRITLVKELADKKEWQKILEFVKGAKQFFLQNFQTRGGCLDQNFEKYHGFSQVELRQMCEEAGEFVWKCGVRG
jgi:pyruvate formate lyase activating enzyme